MKKKAIKKKVIKEEQVDSWVYILLLSAVTILAWVLSKFDFTIGKASLTAAIFLYPFRYFVANMITKKYGVKEALNGISYSTCLLLLFIIVASLLGQQEIDYIPITGEVFGCLVSQTINLTLYSYLLKNTDVNKVALFGSYIFAMLVDNLISMLFISRMIMAVDFWRTYFVTIFIEGIIAIVLIWFDHHKVKGAVKKH